MAKDFGAILIDIASGDYGSLRDAVEETLNIPGATITKTASEGFYEVSSTTTGENAIVYSIEKGDTLTEIANKSNMTVSDLAHNNKINNPNLVYTGQNVVVSGGELEFDPNVSNKVTIQNFGLQSNTDRTVFATWLWDRDNTENYRAVWGYYIDGIWFTGSDSETELKESIYDAPQNCEGVRFRVIPLSETKNVKNKDTAYWTAEWSTYETYWFKENPPTKPDMPSVEVKDYKLTTKLNNVNDDTYAIQFQVVKNNTIVFKTSLSTVKMNYVQYSCYLDAGAEYKVRCRAYRDEKYSDWTEYTENYSTKPAALSGITECRATSENSVYLAWSESTTATSYEIEYTTEKAEYLEGSDKVTSVSDIKYPHYEFTGLESGQEYFFRVRAVNDQGESAWSEVKSVVVGTVPVAPTTWSSTTTVIVGESLTLYWVHNSEDGSAQRYAEIEMYVDDVKETHTVRTVDEEDDEKTMHFAVDTSSYIEGVQIRWRVRTAGVTNEYGDWSIERTVDVYAPPTLTLEVTDADGNPLETLTSFPFYISAEAGPETQSPIGYHVTITSKEAYETTDSMGNPQIVSAGEEVYSKHFDISDDLLLEISAGNVDLQNNVSYTLKVVVSMNSGLTAEETLDFTVAWTDYTFSPNAEIGYDPDTLTVFIMPFCDDENGERIEGISLSVYRREFDGSFTEIATDLDNVNSTYVTDPHPALDYARYRIVATTVATGAVSYYDMPGYPIGETSIIIQWNEAWSNFDVANTDDTEEPSWAGSLLKLPYNVDVQDSNDADVSFVKYIGRNHPVSYYGTQRGATSTWNTEIPKKDADTLYALRRLANWMGDVYVREPSGSGYWASVSVSFSQKHRELTIPITLDITRVEGGA